MPLFETSEIFSHFLGINKLPFENAPAQFFKILYQPVFGLAEYGRLLVPAPFASAEQQSVSFRFLVLDYLDLYFFFGPASRDIDEAAAIEFVCVLLPFVSGNVDDIAVAVVLQPLQILFRRESRIQYYERTFFVFGTAFEFLQRRRQGGRIGNVAREKLVGKCKPECVVGYPYRQLRAIVPLLLVLASFSLRVRVAFALEMAVGDIVEDYFALSNQFRNVLFFSKIEMSSFSGFNHGLRSYPHPSLDKGGALTGHWLVSRLGCG